MLMISGVTPATVPSVMRLAGDVDTASYFVRMERGGNAPGPLECCSNYRPNVFFVHPAFEPNVQHLRPRRHKDGVRENRNALHVHDAPIPEERGEESKRARRLS
jgi:hypothetical protein